MMHSFLLPILLVAVAQDLTEEGAEKFKRGDFDGAIRALSRAIEKDPASVRAHYVRGLAHHARGELGPATEDFTRAVTLNPRFAEGYQNRGVSRAAAGDLEAAIADFTEALKISPSYREALLNRGSARARRKEFDGAIEDYTALLKIEPRDHRVYYNRAVVKGAKGDAEGALTDYGRAIDLRPDFAEAWLNRGVERERTGHFAGAEADCSRAIELNPRYLPAFYNRGVIRALAGKREEAIQDYSSVILLDPRHGHAVARRTRLFYDSQSWGPALADLRKLCELDPAEQAPYRLRIWLVRARMGERPAATEELEAFLSAGRAGAGDPWNKVAAEFLLGRVPEAALVESARTIDPARSTHRLGEAYFYSGTRRLIEGDRDGARSAFQCCVALGSPESAACQSALAELELLGD